MYNLYFLKFNNYINRIIKKFDTIEEYSNYISGVRMNMNFNLNDGINASTEAINIKSADSELTKCNYLISENTETGELCRWFIMECTKTRGKQFIFKLRRDLIADNYDEVLNSTSFIYKGYAQYPDPACIVKENLSFNQIKKEELYLKETEFPFACVVAYVSKQTTFTEGENVVKFNFDKSIDYNNVDAWFGKTFLTKLEDYNINSYSVEFIENEGQYSRTQKINGNIVENGDASLNEIDWLKSSNGLLFYEAGLVYKFEYYAIDNGNNVYNYFFSFKLLSNDDLTYELNFDLSEQRISLDDGYFDMLILPYTDGVFAGKFRTKQDILNIMTSMANNSYFYDVQLLPYRPIDTLNYQETKLSWVKQTQSGDLEYEYNIISFTNDYQIVSSTSQIYQEKEGVKIPFVDLYWCQSSKRDFYIYDYDRTANSVNLINISEKHLLDDDYKTVSNCQTLRLCSPNENSIYEFNAAPNGGIDYYEVDIKYNPYQPYIHINPNYKYLNGNNFNDYRGLICKGNFSLGRATNAWEEYKTQNKNFQQTFDRQIESMEKEINWSLASGVINTTSSAITGAALGSALGPAGMVGGAVLGLAQGTYNTIEQQFLSREKMQTEKDVFNYNLGSIKARPNTISNNNVLDNNNKIFPYLEIYECSDKEKQIFSDIVNYQGMTLNRIGLIKDYLGNRNFIQARIIRTNINDDNHILEELNFELTKGVYFDVN